MAEDRLRYKVTADTANFERGMKRIGAAAKVAMAVVGAAVAKAAYEATQLAIDYEESLNKVDVAFKKNADEIKKWSETTLKSFGVAKGQALDSAALFGDMATSMGLTTDEAAKMAKGLVELGGDLSSFKNVDIKQAMNALKGVFTGETEPLKNLGVVMNVAQLDAFALSEGITATYKSMTQAEKVALRYEYLLSKTANAQGDFERTADGSANQTRIFKGNLEELGITLGQELEPAFNKVLIKLNDWLEALNESSKNDSGLSTFRRTLLKMELELLNVGTALDALITAGGLLDSGFEGRLEKSKKRIAEIKKLLNEDNTFKASNTGLGQHGPFLPGQGPKTGGSIFDNPVPANKPKPKTGSGREPVRTRNAGIKPVNSLVSPQGANLSGGGEIPAYLTDAEMRLREFQAHVKVTAGEVGLILEDFQNVIGQGFADAFYAMGQAINQGVPPLKAAGAAILQTLASFMNLLGTEMVKLGAMAIGLGKAIAAIKKWIIANPWAAVAAGAAIIALAGMFSSAASKTQSSLGGGSSSAAGLARNTGNSIGRQVNPTLTQGRGGETRMIGELRLRGDDLVVGLQAAQQTRTRY